MAEAWVEKVEFHVLDVEAGEVMCWVYDRTRSEDELLAFAMHDAEVRHTHDGRRYQVERLETYLPSRKTVASFPPEADN